MAAEIDFFGLIRKKQAKWFSIDQSLDRHKPFVIIGSIQQIVADAAFPGRMNEPHIARSYFGNNPDMTDTAAFRAISFKENEIPRFGIVQFDRFTVLCLGSTGMGKRNVPLVEAIPYKA
jgi:hypothetical protein